jgi:hypothetical protein
MATTNDIEFTAGDDIVLPVSVYQADGSTPLSIVGATVNWGLAKKVTTEALVSKNTANNGITVTDAANGKCNIYVTHTDTANIKGGSYYHEVEIVDLYGNHSTVIIGTVTIYDQLIK